LFMDETPDGGTPAVPRGRSARGPAGRSSGGPAREQREHGKRQ
jgi:hypothetical protein